MRPDLAAFLAESQTLPFIVGESDCVFWPARWVERVHGRAMALPSVQTRAEADRLVDSHGSLAAACEAAMDEYGLPVVDGWPQPGDVGIVMTPRGPAGGIFGEHGDWFWKARVGFDTLKPVPRRILKAWRV